jgi:hypothetical protein
MNILLYFSVPRNIIAYICQRYIPRLLYRLIGEYNLYFLVIQLCSSIITDEVSWFHGVCGQCMNMFE